MGSKQADGSPNGNRLPPPMATPVAHKSVAGLLRRYAIFFRKSLKIVFGSTVCELSPVYATGESSLNSFIL